MNIDSILKYASVTKLVAGADDVDLICAQSLRPLTAEEVFVFKVAACDNQIDRDYERFTEESLAILAPKFVGKPLISDHKWSASAQIARIYAAEVAVTENVHRIVLRAYMMRTDDTNATISAIEGGILREVSVGCSMTRKVCSICGKDHRERCGHIAGRSYDGVLCHRNLEGVQDAYEVSFVAVPAQPKAGVIKVCTQSEHKELHLSSRLMRARIDRYTERMKQYEEDDLND